MKDEVNLRTIELKNVGYLKYYIIASDKPISPFIELMSVYVKPEFRRRGYGSLLIQNLIDVSRKKDIDVIYTKIDPSNQEVRTFIRKNGFTPSYPNRMLFQRLTHRLISRLHRRLQRMLPKKGSKRL